MAADRAPEGEARVVVLRGGRAEVFDRASPPAARKRPTRRRGGRRRGRRRRRRRRKAHARADPNHRSCATPAAVPSAPIDFPRMDARSAAPGDHFALIATRPLATSSLAPAPAKEAPTVLSPRSSRAKKAARYRTEYARTTFVSAVPFGVQRLHCA